MNETNSGSSAITWFGVIIIIYAIYNFLDNDWDVLIKYKFRSFELFVDWLFPHIQLVAKGVFFTAIGEFLHLFREMNANGKEVSMKLSQMITETQERNNKK